MFIQEFHIDNFRSLVDVHLTDLPPLVVLFGRNGSGKSNILAALEAIFSPKVEPEYRRPEAPISPTPFYRGLLTSFQHNYYRNTPCEIPFRLSLRTSLEELQSLWPVGIERGLFVLPGGTPAYRVRVHLEGSFQPESEFPQAARMHLATARVNDLLLYDGAVPELWLPQKKEQLPTLEERDSIGDALLSRLTGLFSNIGIARFLRREGFPTLEDTQPEPDLASSFKRRLFKVKHSDSQSDQDRYRRIRDLFHTLAGWGEIDFAQAAESLDIMTWDDGRLWLPIARRGAGAEQLLVILSEVVLCGSALVGIEELESNLDEKHQEKLYELLDKLVSEPGSGVGQVIATAHSYFYGHELLPVNKRFVQMDEQGGSRVAAWSKDASRSIFRPWEYYHQLEEQREQDQARGAAAPRRRRK